MPTETGKRRFTLRVATFNTHGCTGLDGRRDVARIARIAAGCDATVVALQEVDSRVDPPNGGPDAFASLPESTGMRGVDGIVRLQHRGAFGNLLLTRLPVASTRRIDLSVPGREPRGAIDAVLRVGRSLLRVVSLHLGLGVAERHLQVGRLLRVLERTPRGAPPAGYLPTVVLGDFNEWCPWSANSRRLGRRFARARLPRTFPSFLPLLPLDRVYADRNVELLHTRVLARNDARRASDHLPVVADIRVPTSTR